MPKLLSHDTQFIKDLDEWVHQRSKKKFNRLALQSQAIKLLAKSLGEYIPLRPNAADINLLGCIRTWTLAKNSGKKKFGPVALTLELVLLLEYTFGDY